ncbi:hypothetical protein EJ06DRAFT_546797 [Trichodelitschia bisporula]|uniref:Uncharacterized protein n=1 Tax=Trichodelitschia bisporula TaxID=703511 RepID=A0A6G1I6C5_9PEZI|nr:hypothetical protein EJ06DRAFT_546797 [Trichodelitschia bisporula]
MTTRTIPGAFVCLQCRLRHLRPREFRAPFEAFRQAGPRHLRFASSQPDAAPDAKPPSPPELKPKRPRKPRKKSAPPPDNTEGSPAGVAVLDAGGTQETPHVDGTNEAGVGSVLGSNRDAILGYLKDKGGGPSEDATYEMIDKLLSSHTQTVPGHISQQEYLDMVKDLKEGFTNKQLQKYASRKDAQELSANLKGPIWVPFTASKWKPKSKESYADRIIKRCWGLTVDDQGDLGHIDVPLKHFEHGLLSVGSPSDIEQLSARKNVQIEATGDKLRIIGTHGAAEDAMAALTELRSTIINKTVWINHLFPLRTRIPNRPHVSSRDLKAVGDLTGSTITATPAPHIYVIRSTNETDWYDARRALVALMSPMHLSTTATLADIQDTSKLSLTNFSMFQYLPFRYRSSKWFRIASPVPRVDGASTKSDEETIESKADPVVPPGLRNGVDSALNRGPVISRLTDLLGTKGVRNSVRFGSVLHTGAANDILESVQAPDQKFNVMNIFAQAIPGLSRVLPYLKLREDKHKTQMDVLSFTLFPSKKPPKDGSVPTTIKVYPRVCVEFFVSGFGQPQQVVEFSRICAVADHATYVCTPARAVDMELATTATSTIVEDLKTASPAVRDFVEQTKANIIGGGLLRAPHAVSLPIIASPGKDDIEVEYMFTSVEHQEIVPLKFEGFPVSYTSMTAGNLGGRQSGLSLRMPGAGEYGDGKTRGEFIEAAFKLQHLIDEAAHGRLAEPPGLIRSLPVEGLPTTTEWVTKAKRARPVFTPFVKTSRGESPSEVVFRSILKSTAMTGAGDAEPVVASEAAVGSADNSLPERSAVNAETGDTPRTDEIEARNGVGVEGNGKDGDGPATMEGTRPEDRSGVNDDMEHGGDSTGLKQTG